MNCWICGRVADTAEHKIKKSVLVALHGKGPYKGDSALWHVKDGKLSDIQGPDSAKIKYAACLCAACNNQRTQPFDFAYDTFFRYVVDNEAEILRHRVIDFEAVYGAGAFEGAQRNLFKYFVKLFGCDLAVAGFPVPNDLRILLDRDQFLTRMRITFAVNEDKIALSPKFGRPTGLGELTTSQRNLSHRDEPNYKWHTYFSFLHTFYWYLMPPDGPFGAEWIANSRYLYLGSYYSLPPEERTKFRENAGAA